MNTFIGNTEAKTDDKGRIFIPAHYRKILSEAGSRHIVMRKDTDNECLVFYPEQVWEQKVRSLRGALDEWEADDQLILMQFMADAEVLDIDNQGRVLLQRKYLEAIGATQEVLFVGMLDRFALWNPQTFAAKRSGQKELADKIREKMRRKAEATSGTK
jgi:MraZ protein